MNNFQVVHLCGKGKTRPEFHHQHYRAFEYLHDEMFDVLAAADLVISRAGANAVYELLALKKLSLLIPLSKKASRGDQLDNAQFAEERGYAKVLQETILHRMFSLNVLLAHTKILKRIKMLLKLFQYQDAIEQIWTQIKRFLIKIN